MAKITVGLSVLFTYLLIVMGNIVTTTGSGLACPDWPLCYGSVVPPLHLDIWIEWGHRLLGGTTGLLVLASTILVWLGNRGPTMWLTGSALALLGVGAILGGVVVLMEAPLLEGALHIFVVSSHVTLATIIFILMIFAFRRLAGSASVNERNVYTLLFGVVFFQALVGILVRYGQAAMACPDFPLCQGHIVPPLDNFETIIHFAHRLTAAVIFAISGWNLFRSIKHSDDITSASATFGLVIIQGAFGASVVLSTMFLPFVVAHGAVGFLLLGWLAYKSAPNMFKPQFIKEARA